MRHLLIPAALVLLAAMPSSASAQDNPNRIGKASVAPQVQDRAQAELRQQAAPQQQGGRGERGAQAPSAQPQAAPQNRGDRNSGQGSRGQYDGNRGYDNRGYDNRRYDNRGYNGPRRDYRGFRDYRRSYNSARRFRGPVYRRPSGWYDHRWSFGEYLPSLFWSSSYWLNDFDRYELPPPPYGTVWVRNGDDALLVDRDSGEIISIRYGVFY